MRYYDTPEKPLPGSPEQSIATAQSQQRSSPTALAPGNSSPPVSAAELYEAAIQHYASKDFEAAENEFTKFLKSDRQSEKAVNARFYLAEVEYQQQDFEGALDDYTEVAPRLSNPSQAATAQYKKALCLLEVERQDEAIRELQAVMERYPRSSEAGRAAKKLRALQSKQGAATRRQRLDLRLPVFYMDFHVDACLRLMRVISSQFHQDFAGISS